MITLTQNLRYAFYKTMFFLLNPVCIRCDSWVMSSSYFCHRCNQFFLIPFLKNKIRYLDHGGKIYKINYQIDWIPEQSDSLSKLIYLLKSVSSKQAWNFYTEFFHELLDVKTCADEKNTSYIIPLPSSSEPFKHHHTKYFSQTIMDRYHYKVVDCLRFKTARKQQKNLPVFDRSEIEICFLEEKSDEIHRAQTLILVDDVVTTGSTLKAALSALKKVVSKDCEIVILTLFSRDKV